VHGIKQLAEAEGKLYNRISGLLTTTVIIVLLLTSLCGNGGHEQRCDGGAKMMLD